MADTVNPNPSFSPPGGYGTNVLPPDPTTGYPAAPDHFWDAYDAFIAGSGAPTGTNEQNAAFWETHHTVNGQAVAGAYDPATDMDNPFSVGGSGASHTITNQNQSTLSYDGGVPEARAISPRERAQDAESAAWFGGAGGSGAEHRAIVGVPEKPTEPPDTTTPPITDDGKRSPFDRLADLMAAQYAAGGGGSGGGMVALPTTIADSGSSSSSSTGMLTVVVVLAVIVGAIWYYKKHHKAAAT